MKQYLKKTLLAWLFLAAAAVCFGGTLTVGKGGRYRNIQDAIDAAESGDLVLIKPGTYTQDESLVISEKSGLELRGERNVTVACTEYVPVIYITQSEEITIRNIHGVHQVKDPAVGKGECGPGATVITAEGCSGVYVSQCELNGCGRTGFEGISSNRIVLEGNYIHDNVNSAVALSWPEIEEEPDVRIEGNRLENNFGPVILRPREGLLGMFFKDTTAVPGLVMRKNRWKNNDKMPRKTIVLNGEKIVFWGPPESFKNDEGTTVVYSGVLDRDTRISVGDDEYEFFGRSVVQFYEKGQVRAGFCTADNSVTLDDGEEVALPSGGRLEFWETGFLKSAELEDGRLLEFDEDGALVSDYGDENGWEHEDDQSVEIENEE